MIRKAGRKKNDIEIDSFSWSSSINQQVPVSGLDSQWLARITLFNLVIFVPKYI